MPIHQLKLLERKTVARATIELLFEKPDGFTFKPGQYGGFTLINPQETDAGGITRRFSLLSAPHDAKIAITTRIQSSAYKRELNALPIGAAIKFAGPTGNFVLHDDESVPAVFIAGGIGITPFYSMITHAIHNHSPRSLTLFYGNNTPEDSAYLEELKKLASTHTNFKLVAVMAHANDQWDGEKGYISYELIKKHVADINPPIYYICGSPVMVNALHETLKELDIADTQIKIEDFPGY